MKAKKIFIAVLALVLAFSMTGCQVMNYLDDKMSEEDGNASTYSENIVKKESSAQESSAADQAQEQSEAADENSSEVSPADSEAEAENSEESDEASSGETAEESASEAEAGQNEASEEASKSAQSEESASSGSAPSLTGDYTGSFSSDTGTALNLLVKWAAKQNPEGTYTVSLQFYLGCGSLFVNARDINTLTVVTSKGETSFPFNTDEVDKADESYSEVYVGKTFFTIPEADMKNGVTVYANWVFMGTYSGKEIDAIDAVGYIQGN
ncbi:MAG: hypothetical protein J6P72_09265 [Firmicutes bacterium]|nr:hypothetical protein [Bacillota bacterium]